MTGPFATIFTAFPGGERVQNPGGGKTRNFKNPCFVKGTWWAGSAIFAVLPGRAWAFFSPWFHPGSTHRKQKFEQKIFCAV
ncbi:MAG: hypothetical protein AVDCRST_MAG56-6605 [uncultured Cytophagales bacterium]|uniref:Uncharacterized protein n=1 Tax=uncultured Cytophagales bacterium TaxID=158755 RepID=A0A6J4KW16_9SPHI|nr:MAG: hypothetical protein AVDCRST_MAG56-6605 [uncultured Cytophagales bacterium]